MTVAAATWPRKVAVAVVPLGALRAAIARPTAMAQRTATVAARAARLAQPMAEQRVAAPAVVAKAARFWAQVDGWCGSVAHCVAGVGAFFGAQRMP